MLSEVISQRRTLPIRVAFYNLQVPFKISQRRTLPIRIANFSMRTSLQNKTARDRFCDCQVKIRRSLTKDKSTLPKFTTKATFKFSKDLMNHLISL